MNTEKLLKGINSMSHIFIALILLDNQFEVYKRIVLLISFGIICGIQNICISHIFKDANNKDKTTDKK